MMPDLDPFWTAVFWLVVTLIVTLMVTAGVVVVQDYRAARRLPPARTDIKHRLQQLPKHPPPQ